MFNYVSTYFLPRNVHNLFNLLQLSHIYILCCYIHSVAFKSFVFRCIVLLILGFLSNNFYELFNNYTMKVMHGLLFVKCVLIYSLIGFNE